MGHARGPVHVRRDPGPRDPHGCPARLKSSVEPRIGIRPCVAADVPAVLALWRGSEASPSPTDTPEAVARLLGEPAAVLLVGLDGDRVVGTVIAGWDGWRGNIYRLAVLPEYR